MTAWFESAFGADYLAIYAHRDLPQARRDVAGLLGLGLSGRVLDLAAGAGRHLEALGERGLVAVGMDLSPELVAAARPGLRLVRADSRRPPFRPASFDVALSLFSSFGYLRDRAEDTAQLAAVAPLLAPGGRLFLDLPQAARLRAELVPRSTRTVAGQELNEVRQLVEGGRRVVKDLTLVGSGSSPTRSYREELNLYDPDELEALLGEAGFAVEARWGDLSGLLFADGESGSLRQVVRARRLL